MEEELKVIQDAAVGISQVGWKVWISSNWWTAVLAIVGLGHIIVKLTPTKKDDKWYGKFILRPVRFIGKIFALDVKRRK